jgi:hypothetical protein
MTRGPIGKFSMTYGRRISHHEQSMLRLLYQLSLGRADRHLAIPQQAFANC